MLGENGFRALVGVENNPLDFFVDFGSNRFGIVADVVIIAADKHFVVVFAEGNRAEFFAHAVFGDHFPGDFGGAFNVVGSTGGNIVENQIFGNAPAQKTDNVVKHSRAHQVHFVFFGLIHREAARHAARYNGNVRNGVFVFQIIRGNGVAGLVVSGNLFVALGDAVGFLFRTDKHFHRGFFDFRHGNRFFLSARRKQRRFVQQVFEVRAGEADGCAGNRTEVHIGT